MPSKRTFDIDWKSAGRLEPGLKELAASLPDRFASGSPALRIALRMVPNFNGFRLRTGPEGTELQYGRPCDAFRALGALLGGELPSTDGSLEETAAFASMGVMLDVSRNAVLRVEAIESLFRRFALMGINSVQLYMEDSYLLEGEPFFGYARGAYSREELSRIDAYGALLGIEVVPCIQTLGHLEQILQWPAYSELIDVPGVLLVGEEQTYRLIEKMLDAVGSCFRTRRVHIGMDEAHGVGQGRYRKRHGNRRSFDVLNDHLQRVAGLCEARGLRPLIWSDMFFRIGSADNDYYDREATIPDEIAAQIPAGVELVYWDYYHTDPDFYREWIDRHRALGREPLFAAGGWTWGRLWAHLPHAMTTVAAGMRAAREKKLGQAFITLWGDDGAECDPFSMLPAVQYFAECGHASEVTPERLQARFAGSCGGDFAGCLLASQVDAIPSIDPAGEGYANFGKWILWHDPVLNFLEKQIPECLPAHYRELAEALEKAIGTGSDAIHRRFAATLARALAGKSRLHLEVRPCYRDGRLAELRALSAQTLPETVAAIKELWKLHRTIWHRWHKPFGWDVIERRYAGVLARLEALGAILNRHLENPGDPIEEFDCEPQPIHPKSFDPRLFFKHGQAASASVWK